MEFRFADSGSAVSITSHSLGDGSQDMTADFFAAQTDRAGNESACSSVSVSYVLDVTAPAMPSALILESPSTSPNTDSTPTIKVSGVEGGATVTIYRDSICTDAISDSVKVNRWGKRSLRYKP